MKWLGVVIFFWGDLTPQITLDITPPALKYDMSIYIAL